MDREIPLWRSMLFVPVNVDRFVNSAARRGADACILDLEDSIPAGEKSEARKRVRAAAETVGSAGADVVVRINRPWRLAIRDIEASVSPNICALAVPKVADPGHLCAIGETLSELEAERGLKPGHTRLIAMIETLLKGMSQSLLGEELLTYQGEKYDFSGPFSRMTVEEVVCKYNPDIDNQRLRDRDYLVGIAEALEIKVEENYGAGKLQIEIFEKTGETQLRQPTFVTHLPKELIPLAKLSPDDPSTIEVFECCINGQEIAPAYTEQNDPVAQREALQNQAGGEQQKLDEDFLVALEHGMPSAGGIGIGIDRLIMMLLGQESIRDVLLFPQLKPKTTTAEG